MSVTGKGPEGEIQRDLKDGKWNLFMGKKLASPTPFVSLIFFHLDVINLCFMIILFKVHKLSKSEKVNTFPK